MSVGRRRLAAIVGTTLATAAGAVAWGNAGSHGDSTGDSEGPASTDIIFAQHKHRSETRLDHSVYTDGKPHVNDPPNLYFDTDDDQVADFKFRHARGRDEVVLLSDADRTRPAVVSKVTKHGLSIRFQEGAIRTPSTYRWYAAYETNGEVLDRAPDETWIFHNLEVHD